MTNGASRTFGAFFDAVAVAVAAEHIGYAHVHMAEWCRADSGITWKAARAMELSDGLFRAFAQDMDAEFRDLLRGTSGESAYAHRLQAGQQCQRVIARIGREFGLPEAVCAEADAPLTPSDALARSQVARPS